MTVDQPAGGAPWDVIVVGAGQAGLALGGYLRRAGFTFRIVDAGAEVGHVWRSRWDSMRLLTPAQYDGLPGLAFPGPGRAYPTKDEVADYLAEYARRFDLRIQLDTAVTGLARGRGHWIVRTAAGDSLARQVVVATGEFAHGHVPLLAARLNAAVVQLHSSVYRRPGQIPPGRVLVVGGGTSGRQIAAELASTHRVDLSVRHRRLRVPQRLLHKDIYWWRQRLGLLNVRPGSSRGRDLPFRGDPVIGPGSRALRKLGVELRSGVVSASGRLVSFDDSSGVAFDAVIWATGYRADDSWVGVPGVLDRQGRLIHHDASTAAPGLYVLGRPGQRSAGSELLGIVGSDAARLAGHLDVSRT